MGWSFLCLDTFAAAKLSLTAKKSEQKKKKEKNLFFKKMVLTKGVDCGIIKESKKNKQQKTKMIFCDCDLAIFAQSPRPKR